jgi:hypothetical protein
VSRNCRPQLLLVILGSYRAPIRILDERLHIIKYACLIVNYLQCKIPSYSYVTNYRTLNARHLR